MPEPLTIQPVLLILLLLAFGLVAHFLAIARLALKNDRQLLEGLGITVKSRNTSSAEKRSA